MNNTTRKYKKKNKKNYLFMGGYNICVLKYWKNIVEIKKKNYLI